MICRQSLRLRLSGNNNLSYSESRKALIIQCFPGFLLFTGYKVATFECFFVANRCCHVVATIRASARLAGWLLQFVCSDTDGCRFPSWSAHARVPDVLRSTEARTPFPPADWRVNGKCRDDKVRQNIINKLDISLE